MSADGLSCPDSARRAAAALPPLGRAWRRLAAVLRSPGFWQVQGLLLFITLADHFFQIGTRDQLIHHFHHIGPVLFAIPIAAGALHFGRPGAVLTTLWTVPLLIFHLALHDGPEECMTIEIMQLGVGWVVGLTLALIIMRQTMERRRAEEMSALLAKLHHGVVRSQEEEGRRIARELHDEPVQGLVVLCRGLDSVAVVRNLPQTARDELRKLRAVAEQIATDIRRVSRDLRPTVLDDLGLEAAVRWLAADLAKRSGAAVQVEVTGPPRRLSSDTEHALFRAVQESLRNVEKHAAASAVTVTLAFLKGGARVTVSDDGKGFAPPASLNSLAAAGRLGLVGIQERVQLLGGSLDIQSAAGKGACITITVNT